MKSYNTIVFLNCGKIKVMSIKRLTDKGFKSNKQINSTIKIMNMPNQVLRSDNYLFNNTFSALGDHEIPFNVVNFFAH